jgi:3-dehydroquinate dehydratase type I
MNIPKICIAVPITSLSIYENKELLSEAVSHDPDFIELRFDYLDATSGISSDFIQSILDFSDIPMICTFRKFSEGGNSDISDSERISILNKIIKAKPQFIDIEMDNPLGFLEDIILKAKNNNIAIIFSHHNFTDTPPSKQMHNIIKSFRTKLKTLNSLNSNFFASHSFVWKLIFTANQFEDNLEVLTFCRNVADKNRRLISFCMGELGIFSRLLSALVGGFFTFGSLANQTAPGQINIELMRKFYALFQE